MKQIANNRYRSENEILDPYKHEILNIRYRRLTVKILSIILSYLLKYYKALIKYHIYHKYYHNLITNISSYQIRGCREANKSIPTMHRA